MTDSTSSAWRGQRIALCLMVLGALLLLGDLVRQQIFPARDLPIFNEGESVEEHLAEWDAIYERETAHGTLTLVGWVMLSSLGLLGFRVGRPWVVAGTLAIGLLVAWVDRSLVGTRWTWVYFVSLGFIVGTGLLLLSPWMRAYADHVRRRIPIRRSKTE